jgi:hypothetical protein
MQSISLKICVIGIVLKAFAILCCSMLSKWNLTGVTNYNTAQWYCASFDIVK